VGDVSIVSRHTPVFKHQDWGSYGSVLTSARRRAGRRSQGETTAGPGFRADRCPAVAFSPLRCRLLRGIGLWRSLVAHLTGGQGVAGSNPVSPTSVSAGQRRPVPGRGKFVGALCSQMCSHWTGSPLQGALHAVHLPHELAPLPLPGIGAAPLAPAERAWHVRAMQRAGRVGVWAYGRMVACMFALGTVELTIMAVGGVLVLVLIVWLLVKSARRDPQRK
jgi:hypothetical protein